MYMGELDGSSVRVIEKYPNGIISMHPLELTDSLQYWDHSPTGFGWGYRGSGASQLAMALLLDVYKDARDPKAIVEQCAHRFKTGIIQDLQCGWALRETEITNFVLMCFIEDSMNIFEVS